VKLINNKISVFLACNLLLVTLTTFPKFKLSRKTKTTKIEISIAENSKIHGYTKNEVTSSQLIDEQSQKDSQTLKSSEEILFVYGSYSHCLKLTKLNLLFFSGTIQLGLKALIFPFHTFW
jgi:hypothetical protein